MGSIIDLIVKEVANPDRDNLDTQFLFPFLRNFDVYDGRSLADGAANNANGNNQESSSESINFATGLIQWGQATGDQNLQNLGEYLYDTEVNAFYDYYFNENPNTGTFPPGFSTTANPAHVHHHRLRQRRLADDLLRPRDEQGPGHPDPAHQRLVLLPGRTPAHDRREHELHQRERRQRAEEPGAGRRRPDLGRRLPDHDLRLPGPRRPADRPRPATWRS